jgi:hypothetical protein
VKIIVNADDYGANEVCTMAICEAFKEGLLSQTTTMANMPWFSRGAELAKECGFFKNVGLHFNLTEGSPLTREMQECDFFCDRNGFFSGRFHLSLETRLVLPHRYKHLLENEVRAQIERYLNAGYKMMHLDSHHHIHTDFSIAYVLLPIAKEYGFKTCRLSRTISSNGMGFAKKAYKLAYNHYLQLYMKPLSNEMTDFADFKLLCETLQDKSSVEIMVHPGDRSEYDMREQISFWEDAAGKGISVYRAI